MKQDCNTSKSFCNSFDPTTYNSNNKLFKNIIFDGGICIDAITNTNYVGIYAKEYVLLDGVFSIDNNSTVTIDVRDCNTAKTYFGAAPPEPAPAFFIQKLHEVIE